MIYIPAERFEQLRLANPDCVMQAQTRHEHMGRVCEAGEWMAYESALTGDHTKGASLVFEHIHFEILAEGLG